MSIVISKNHNSPVKDELKKNLNCILVSGDGFRVNIQEKLINQTQFMRNLLEDAKDPDFCDSKKVFLIFCTEEELKKLVQFLLDGKIHCENEDESLKILGNLKKPLWIF